MELTKEQARALASVLFNEIKTEIRNRNKEAIKEIENDETFNNAYNEYLTISTEAKKLYNKAEQMKASALKNLRNKLAGAVYCECDSKNTMIHTYAKQLGKITDEPTKQDIVNRIMLATIDAEDLQDIKENVLKLF